MTGRATVESQPAGRDWRQESVMVATPHRFEFAANYVQSMLSLTYYDAANCGHLVRAGGPFLASATPMNLHEVRNAMAGAAVDKGVDWILFVDSDAGFEPNVVERLVECADPVDRPVLGALAFMTSKAEPDDMGGWIWHPAPTIYDWGHDGKEGFFHRYDYPPNTLVRAAATGGHMLLIHRGVLEKIEAAHGRTWFNRGMYSRDHGLMGEDFSFCFRLLEAGVPLHVHTGIETTHQQTVWLNSDDYLKSRVLRQMAAAVEFGQVPDGVKVAAVPDE